LGANPLTISLNLPAQSRRQSAYVVFTTLRRPVFLVNSSLAHFSAASRGFNTPTQALLLPKLRSKFAEFLHESYLEPLRLLASHTSVSLWYGHHWATRDAFLVSLAVTASVVSPTLHWGFGLGPFSPGFNAVHPWRSQLMTSPAMAT
jgi:hypothetical protein